MLTDWLPSAQLADLYGTTQATVSRVAPNGGTVRGLDVECAPATEAFRTRWEKSTRTKWMFRGPLPAGVLQDELERLRPALRAARCRLGGQCDTYPDCDHHHGDHPCVVCESTDRVRATAAKAGELAREVESLRETIANLRRSPETREVQLLRELEATLRARRREARAIEAHGKTKVGATLQHCEAELARLGDEAARIMDKLDDLRRAQRRS